MGNAEGCSVMADEWIKMRPTLLTSPKVNRIARILENDLAVTEALSTGYDGPMKDIVGRNVMRNVTVCALLTVWGAANEHTRDGKFKNTDLDYISEIAGIPLFGQAMESVGLAIFDEDENSVTFPNFNEYNTCGADRTKEKNRERQARYREKQKKTGDKSDGNSNGKRNVTDDVTSNAREEKRREDNNIRRFTPPTVVEVKEYCDSRCNSVDPENFIDHYEANGWVQGKGKPIKNWKACVRTWEKNSRAEPTVTGEMIY